MNYYEHHIGDYLRDTAHLSMLEDAAYRRLLDRYYTSERPLPADLRECCKIARASSKAERAAVQAVLREFFREEPDGWHQSRADKEIARYRDGEPEREAKKANEEARLRRHREERSRLFKVITDAGQHAAWNIGMNELRELAKRCEQPLPPMAPAMAPATPATATQTPSTRHHIPDTKHQTPEEGHALVPDGGSARASPGAVCAAMKAEGIVDVNPGNALLRTLLEAGATEAEFVGAARVAARGGKRFAYVLGMVRGQREDAASVAKSVHNGALPNRQQAQEQRNRSVGEEWARKMREQLEAGNAA